jgi:hypothetical protein
MLTHLDIISVGVDAINMSGFLERRLAWRRDEVNVSPKSRTVAAQESRSIARRATVPPRVAHRVQLIYFRPTGKYLATVEVTIKHDALVEIWEEVDDMRRLGRLPGLRPGAGRDLLIVVDVPDHPQRVLHMVMPPFVDEDDVTPPRIPTGEMMPLVRVPLDEMPRTTTRDVVKLPVADLEADTVVASDDEITPVDLPIKPPSKYAT